MPQLDPVIWFFVLGVLAGAARSDLRLPAAIYEFVSTVLLLSIGLAFLFISILMGVLFRNAKLVLISLVPNVVPLLLIAGLMGVTGIEIKPATAVIFSIAFGIAVDDTIHMLARLRQDSSP